MIISLLNQKGGAGKTTTTINLAVSLFKDGYKVLIVDLDPQASIRHWDEANENNPIPIIAADTPTSIKKIKSTVNAYDFVIMDGAPSLSTNMAAAIHVSDVVLIPIKASPLDIWAVADIVDAIKSMQELGKNLKAYFVINQTITNAKLTGEAKDIIKEYKIPCMESTITTRVVYPEMIALGLSVFDANNNKAKNEVLALKEELLQIIK